MMRAARAVHAHVQPLLSGGDRVTLDETAAQSAAAMLNYASWSVKLKKRALLPLRLRFRRFDVLHIIDSDYAAAVPRARAGRAVITCHDMMPFLVHPRIEDAFAGRAGLMFYRRGLDTMARCARVVCDSDFTRACVRRYSACRDEQLAVIFLGVDACFRPIGKDAPVLQSFIGRHGLAGKHVVLHVGSTDSYKNIETVLEVTARLRDSSGGRVALLKVGGRFTAEQAALIVRRRLGEHVVHVTGLGEEDLVAAYNAADVLLWPSHFEGFGLPAAEAMACGTPVVCSNGGALPEVVGGAAAVHDPNDIEGLTQSCWRVLSDPAEAGRLRALGLRRATEFSWERTAAAYYEVYKSVHAARSA